MFDTLLVDTPVTLISNQQESSRTSRNEEFSKFAPRSFGSFKLTKILTGLLECRLECASNLPRMFLTNSRYISSLIQLECSWNTVGIFRMLLECSQNSYNALRLLYECGSTNTRGLVGRSERSLNDRRIWFERPRMQTECSSNT